jgi:ComF family protein
VCPATLSTFLANKINNCPIFNQSCILCGTHTAQRGFCLPCRHSLRKLPEPHCPRCAQPLFETGVCGHCQRHPPAFDAIHVPFVFCYPLNALIWGLKYGKRLELAGILGGLFYDSASKIHAGIDLVIPVPLSKERLAIRGFNQSDELARTLTGTIANRFQPALCGRKRNTLPQAHLGRRQRQRNLRNAFCVETRLDGLSVAIVDDVVTTGFTLDAMAETLKKQGAKRVEAWALACTIARNT